MGGVVIGVHCQLVAVLPAVGGCHALGLAGLAELGIYLELLKDEGPDCKESRQGGGGDTPDALRATRDSEVGEWGSIALQSHQAGIRLT